MRYFIYARKSSEGEERQVLSLASQQEALAKSFGDRPEIEIVGVYEEAKSAKSPGRPLFAEMLRRIEAGEAEGIASWAPDRLARNSIDGGHIIYLLDRGILHDLKFATYTFENNSQGKFMLGIMFNQSKYYSDALSENVKRGNATKVAMGWRPNSAPIGYLNCPQTRTIIPDPNLFPLIRRMFDLFLTGAYTPRQIARIAQDDWGLLTPRKPRSGGKPLARSTLYRIFANPFYAGILSWKGTKHPGRHQPMLTIVEFERVLKLLKKTGTTRPARYTFAFTGLLSCGNCGRAVTAEQKVNKYGSRYTYYHCAARSRISMACAERSLEEAKLTDQFSAFLASIAIKPSVANWVRTNLEDEHARAIEISNKVAVSQNAALAEIRVQLKELTSLRLRRMVDDEEFTIERTRLDRARLSLENAVNNVPHTKLIELLNIAERISIQAPKWFAKASPSKKQRILKILCSNLILKDKKLNVQATKPFIIRSELDDIVHVRGVVDEVRTFTGACELLQTNLYEIRRRGEIDATIATFKELEGLRLQQDRLPEARTMPRRGLPFQPLRQAISSHQNPVRRRR